MLLFLLLLGYFFFFKRFFSFISLSLLSDIFSLCFSRGEPRRAHAGPGSGAGRRLPPPPLPARRNRRRGDSWKRNFHFEVVQEQLLKNKKAEAERGKALVPPEAPSAVSEAGGGFQSELSLVERRSTRKPTDGRLLRAEGERPFPASSVLTPFLRSFAIASGCGPRNLVEAIPVSLLAKKNPQTNPNTSLYFFCMAPILVRACDTKSLRRKRFSRVKGNGGKRSKLLHS